MLLWNIYRIETIAFGASKTKLASGCAGTILPDKSCTFDEFLKHIDRAEGKAKNKRTGSTGAEKELHRARILDQAKGKVNAFTRDINKDIVKFEIAGDLQIVYKSPQPRSTMAPLTT
ncbi:hypothetical protein B0H67DRAFT_643307 [Lasiosphaeris hirsuta]|uniref:Uncharacterized protein n=1 Tax=Lasiosphaeris hirsuta TaxID=260670 RepID=A0AA40AQ93_9PEZI|nr:hypothetical protein B0H67DRAFT_643307 [Lasiosphaeris hirsuta]